MIFVTLYFFVVDLISCYNFILTLSFDIDEILFLVITDGAALTLSFILQAMFIHVGLSTTHELEETPVIVSKIINSHSCDENDRELFKNLLIQNQYRNLRLKTSFFTINWKLLLTVRFKMPTICQQFGSKLKSQT